MNFRTELAGGHPNSLGNTSKVVQAVEDNPIRLLELLGCYLSSDEVLRFRTSNALKKISRAHPDWVVPHLPFLFSYVAELEQFSAQWTLAQVFGAIGTFMTDEQRQDALRIMKRNLVKLDDWLVLTQTMNTLALWAQTDSELRDWLIPRLMSSTHDSRKSVSKRAAALLNMLSS